MPLSAGGAVTVSGVNFGVSNLSPSVRMGVTLCQATTFVSNTAVRCQMLQGAGAALPIRLSLEGVSGTFMRAFTYDAPAVTLAAGATNMPNSAGVSITLSGINFGATDSNPKAGVGGTSCQISAWIAATSVSCLPSGGVGASLAASVEVYGLGGTVSKVFSYDSPVVTALVLNNGPVTAGSTVTIAGQNFGTSAAQIAIAGLVEGRCSTTIWVSTTSLACTGTPTMLAGAGVGRSFLATIGGLVGTLPLSFTYDAPLVNRLYTTGASPAGPPNAPVSGKASITLVGGNFGAVGSTPTVLIGSTACETAVWTTFSSVVCAVAPGSGRFNIRASVIVGSQIGSVQSIFTYDAPFATALVGNTPLSGSGVVTLLGLNFGSSDSSPTAFLGDTSCSSTRWLTTTAMSCSAAAGSGQALTVKAVAFELTGTQLFGMTYDAPVVTRVFGVANGPTTGGSVYTIQGANFGSSKNVVASASNTPAVDGVLRNCVVPNGGLKSVAGVVLYTKAWVSDTQLICLSSSAGSGPLQPVAVSTDSVTGALPSAFTFDAPVVTAVANANGPTSGGAVLSVYGMNFGDPYTAITSPLGSLTQTKDGMPVAMQCDKAGWASDNAMSCATPPGIGAVFSLDVDSAAPLSGVTHSGRLTSYRNSSAFRYDAPVVTSIVGSSNLPTKGGAIATITGFNFGVTNSKLSISVGDTACGVSKWISNTAVSCLSPPGLMTSNNAVVSASVTLGADASSAGTLVNGFLYDASFFAPPKGADYKEATSRLLASSKGTSTANAQRTGNRRAATSAVTTYYTSVGELLNVSFVATAEDTATNVAIASWSGAAAASFTGYEPKMTSKPKGRMAYGEFTWSPGETGLFTLCANLIDSKLVVQDTICVQIAVLNCEHLVQPGETLDSIASLYKITSRTLWWLNPTLNPSPADSSRTVYDDSSLTLQVGNVIRIGRTYTLRSGESLTTIVKDLKSSWYWVNQVRIERCVPDVRD
jgi:hypothetical protein